MRADAGTAATATLSRFVSIRSDYFDAIRAWASVASIFAFAFAVFVEMLWVDAAVGFVRHPNRGRKPVRAHGTDSV